MARDMQRRGPVERRGRGVRPLHTLMMVAVGVAAVVIAFWAFSFVVGVIAFLVKVVVVVAIFGALFWLLAGRRR